MVSVAAAAAVLMMMVSGGEWPAGSSVCDSKSMNLTAGHSRERVETNGRDSARGTAAVASVKGHASGHTHSSPCAWLCARVPALWYKLYTVGVPGNFGWV